MKYKDLLGAVFKLAPGGQPNHTSLREAIRISSGKTTHCMPSDFMEDVLSRGPWSHGAHLDHEFVVEVCTVTPRPTTEHRFPSGRLACHTHSISSARIVGKKHEIRRPSQITMSDFEFSNKCAEKWRVMCLHV